MNIEEAYNTIKKSVEAINTRGYATKAEYEKVECIKVLLTAYEKEKEKNKELEKKLDLDYAEEKIKEAYIDGTNVAHNLCNKKWVEIIQAQIQELENERKDLVYAQPFVDGQIGVLKRVLKRGEE